MRSKRFFPVVLALAVVGGFSGCSSEGGARLPAALVSRWSPPAFATRTVDAVDVRTVTVASKQAALGAGFVVQRFDESGGVVSAVRRQTNAFDGARQETLEIRVSLSAPGLVQIAVVLREVVESGSGDERSAPMVTAALVRDRGPYDTFFDRLTAILAAR